MKSRSIRNIAIIAHVDHGKTTLVDRMLFATGTLRQSDKVQERVLDSNDLERERGITIVSKNIAVVYEGIKINIIDTPGHADFGGEVERVLAMADGVLLLVDAFDGPMPQTRFVLKKALGHGLKPIVVINKVDRPDARPHEVLEEVFDLFVELEATNDQLDFPVVYTSATQGYARREIEDDNRDLTPLMDAICRHIPPPRVDRAGPAAMQVCALDYNDYVGRIGIGRVFSGSLRADAPLLQRGRGGDRPAALTQLLVFEGLGRREVAQADAGDIVAVVGAEEIDIGDVFTDPERPVALPPITIDEPTIAMVFSANTSAFAGREARFSTGRHLRERLHKEAKANITVRVEDLPGEDGLRISGRGTLHLSILIETMRREGYEFEVARPQIIFKDVGGRAHEPVEHVVVDVPGDHAGKVIELMGGRCGELLSMTGKGGMTHCEFRVPSRGLIGMRTKVMSATRGEAVFCHNVCGYEPCKGPIAQRVNGVMVSMCTASAVAYALDGLQMRGRMFVAPGDPVYEGMIVGEHAKPNDIIVNVARTKQLTNMRAAGSDKNIILTPPVAFSLEEALEYLNDDELLEVTPKAYRFRKQLLTDVERRRRRRAG
ncbi:MAG TPA: translational GTPase TypA [Planctomycetes bacterium]|nr:translational GTPase TypA [Planctomycetota bacterium]